MGLALLRRYSPAVPCTGQMLPPLPVTQRAVKRFYELPYLVKQQTTGLTRDLAASQCNTSRRKMNVFLKDTGMVPAEEGEH